MERLSSPIFSMVMQHLTLREMESLARAAPWLYHVVARDPLYHHKIRRFTVMLEKQVRYLEKNERISRDMVHGVRQRHLFLVNYYQGFTKNSLDMTPPSFEGLHLLFPTNVGRMLRPGFEPGTFGS